MVIAPGRHYAILRRRMSQFTRALGRRLGYHAVRANHYSPIPDVDALPPALWHEAAPMPGVDLRLAAGGARLEDHLARYTRTYTPVANPMYPAVDSEILSAMVRWLE